jgi:hypothetical protein
MLYPKAKVFPPPPPLAFAAFVLPALNLCKDFLIGFRKSFPDKSRTVCWGREGKKRCRLDSMDHRARPPVVMDINPLANPIKFDD